MTLTLRILTHARLENGRPTELVLHNRGAIIGRAATCEWPLPDDTRTLSGRHCEIQYRQDDYFLLDHSTNGTYLGDTEERIGASHKIAPGDRFRMGPYIIEAKLSGAALERHRALLEAQQNERRGPGFSDWNDVPGSRPAQRPSTPGFSDDGGWGLDGPAPERASHWSEDINRSSQERSADEIFDSFAASNRVDWSSVWSTDSKSDPFAASPGTVEKSGFAPLNPDRRVNSDSFAPLAPGGGSSPAPSGSDPFGGPLNPGQPAPAPSGDPFGGPLNPGQSAPPRAAPGADPFGGPLAGGNAIPAQPWRTGDPFGGPLNPPSPTDRHPPREPAPAPSPGRDPFGGPLNPGYAPDQPTSPFSAPDTAPLPFAAPLPDETTSPPSRAHAASPQHPPPAVAQSPAPHHFPAPAASPPYPTQPLAAPDVAYAALLGALGMTPEQVKVAPEAAAAQAGRMLRHLLAGLMTLLEARARAKDEMGASATQLRFDGNNPMKFARNIDQALQMMLNPAMRGYMEAEQAIEDSYRDLQAHQIATLKAMQGALRATIERFSPAAMKARTESSGLLEKVLPGQRDAALWKAYERQFSGVAHGSAEAFLEVFSKEFRQAYEDAVHSD
jgi:type VI secretion system FHA domain protein